MMVFSNETTKLLSLLLIISFYIFLNLASCASTENVNLGKQETLSMFSLGSYTDNENTSSVTQKDIIAQEPSVARAHHENSLRSILYKPLVKALVFAVGSLIAIFAIYKGVVYVQEKTEAAEKKAKEISEQRKVRKAMREEKLKQEQQDVAAAEPELQRLSHEVDKITLVSVENVEEYEKEKKRRSEVYEGSEQNRAEHYLKMKPDPELSVEEQKMVKAKREAIFNDRALKYIKLSNPTIMIMGAQEFQRELENFMKHSKVSLYFIVTDLPKLNGINVIPTSEKDRYRKGLVLAFEDAYAEKHREHEETYKLMAEKLSNIIDFNNQLAFFQARLQGAFGEMKLSDKDILEMVKDDQA